MVRIEGQYTDKHGVKLIHTPSNCEIHTTPPVDNGGTGDRFSPTDLLAASFGSCMLTIMSLHASRSGIDLHGAKFSVEKTMTSTPPRRVQKLELEFTLPDSVPVSQRNEIEEKGSNCPVTLSVHPEVDVQVTFNYQKL